MTLAQIATPAVDWYALAPLLVLLAGSGICVLAAVLLPESWKLPAGAVTAVGCFVGAAGTQPQSSSPTASGRRASSQARRCATGWAPSPAS